MRDGERFQIPDKCRSCPMVGTLVNNATGIERVQDESLRAIVRDASEDELEAVQEYIRQNLGMDVPTEEISSGAREGANFIYDLAGKHLEATADTIESLTGFCSGALRLRAVRNNIETTATICQSEIAPDSNDIGKPVPTFVSRRNLD